MSDSRPYVNRFAVVVYKSSPEYRAVAGSLRRDLLMEREAGPVAGGQASRPFFLYTENAAKVYLPRRYGIEHVPTARPYCPSRPPESLSAEAVFTGSLKPAQRGPVDRIVAHVEAERARWGWSGGMVKLPTGFGKTVIALHLIAHFRMKTLVIVNTGYLMQQFADRATTFMPGARLGRIQGPTCDVDDRDIVIGTYQTLALKDDADFPRGLFERFGLVIIDEAHHSCAERFSMTLTRCAAPIVLGLSATPERTDGLLAVFQAHVGPMIVAVDELFAANPRVLRPIVHEHRFIGHDPATLEAIRSLPSLRGKDGRPVPNMSAIMTLLTLDAPRTAFIVGLIRQVLTAEPHRRLLVLTDRRDHVRELVAALGSDTAGAFLGQTKMADLTRTAAEARVIVGTAAMTREAFDVPTLDTLVFAVPYGNIKQMVGRILRREYHDYHPWIIDVYEPGLPVLGGRRRQRRNYYRESGITFNDERSQSASPSASPSATTDYDIDE